MENTIVAKDKDKVIGFAVYSSSRDEDLPDAGEVDAIYVLSEYSGRKVGYRLMNEAISRLSEYNTFFVWVFEKNERAINFYHKYGFEFDGCRQLNSELREKYPIIDQLLDIADRMPRIIHYSPYSNNSTRNQTNEAAYLQQDHVGILCHVLMKKNIIREIEEWIDYVD